MCAGVTAWKVLSRACAVLRSTFFCPLYLMTVEWKIIVRPRTITCGASEGRVSLS